MRHALLEMLLGRARPAALRRGGGGGDGGGGGSGPTTTTSGIYVLERTQHAQAAAAAAGAAAAQGLAAAALGPAVAACMCVVEGASKATWRRTARCRPQSGAGAQVEAGRCLVRVFAGEHSTAQYRTGLRAGTARTAGISCKHGKT